jgi:hypothetical protein
MSTNHLRATVGLTALILLAGDRAFAQHMLTIYFGPGDDTVPAQCKASMDPGDKTVETVKGDTFTWTIVNRGCLSLTSPFDPTKVRLVFVSDAFPSRTLRGNSSGLITSTVVKDKKKAKHLSRHPYFITYDKLFAGDPEIDINDPQPPPFELNKK